MTRNQLEHALLKLSRSQPSDEQMGSILAPPVPITKPVKSLDDQILDFGIHLKSYDTENNSLSGIKYEEKCMEVVKSILAEMEGDVRESLQGKKVDIDEGCKLWSSRVDSLFEIAKLVVSCNTKSVGRILAEIARAMVILISTTPVAALGLTSIEAATVQETCTTMMRLIDCLEKDTPDLNGRVERLNDLVIAHAIDRISHGEDEPKMPFAKEDVNRLPNDDNYRTQEQQPPSDTPSHYQDDYSVVSDDLTTEGENFRPEAMARWAGLDWNGGNHDDDDYSDDERLSYNSDYESP